MNYDKVKEFHERRPFKPFDIKMSDGRVYTVDHPEFLMQSRKQRVVVFTTDDDREVALAVEHIVALKIANTCARLTGYAPSPAAATSAASAR